MASTFNVIDIVIAVAAYMDPCIYENYPTFIHNVVFLLFDNYMSLHFFEILDKYFKKLRENKLVELDKMTS